MSTNSHNLNVSRLVLHLSLPNPLKPGFKWWMKMQLEVLRCHYHLYVVGKDDINTLRYCYVSTGTNVGVALYNEMQAIVKTMVCSLASRERGLTWSHNDSLTFGHPIKNQILSEYLGPLDAVRAPIFCQTNAYYSQMNSLVNNDAHTWVSTLCRNWFW